jgi:DNA-binding transcriptional regulator YhcF (GntR family)
MLNIYYVIYILFIISILIIFFVLNSNIHKNEKYKSLLQLLTALTILFTSFAIVLQIYTFNAGQTIEQIKIYEQIFDDLFEEITTYFETYPKMNYYYDQMFHPLNYNNKTIVTRYYTEEQQVTSSILQKIASIIYFVENDKTLNQEDKNDVTDKLDKFITSMVKSPIFLENYNNLRKTFISITLKNYMKEHFNI